MHCPECHQFLQDHFDGEAGDGAALQQHLAGCPGCRELYAIARRLEDGLRTLVPPLPPQGLSGHIVARIMEQQRIARRFRRRLLAGAGVAASFLVLALIGYVEEKRGVIPWRPVLQNSDPSGPAIVSEPTAPLPSLREEVAEAGTAGVAVARRVTEETVQPIRRMLWPDPMPTPNLPGAEVLQQTVEPAAEGVQQLKHGVAVVGEPVTTGLRRWGDLMLRHLPADETDRKPGL